MNGSSSITATPRSSSASLANRPGALGSIVPSSTTFREVSHANYFSNISSFGRINVGSFQGRFEPSSAFGKLSAHLSQADSKGARPGALSALRNSPLNSLTSSNASPFAQSALGASKGIQSLGAPAATKAAGAAAGPVSMAAQLAQDTGKAIGQGLEARDNARSAADFAHNSAQYSVASRQNATAIRAHQQSSIANNATGAMIGSLFGPVGALAGHFAASLLNDNNRTVFNANSFNGGVDPTDRGIAQSGSTAAPSGNSVMRDTIHDGAEPPTGAS
ncbi:hypothetical protein [Linepithema humile polycipivirus 2]|nr:hypothetical protein [Linepithema humile polycipivirus 2]UXD80044.1 hypothetical protein [Linepithema humile polycipivirus 2]